MKRKSLMMGSVLSLMVILLLAGCETEDDNQNVIGNATVVIAKPRVGTVSRTVYANVDKTTHISVYHVSAYDYQDKQVYNENKTDTAFPLTIKLPVGKTTFTITAINKEKTEMASGQTVVILNNGNNNINIPLEWNSPVFTIPDGFHEVPGTTNFSETKQYSDTNYLCYNPNNTSTFLSPSMLYLVKAGQQYYIPPLDIPADDANNYQFVTNGNADGCFYTKYYQVGFNFIANQTGNIKFIGNVLSPYGKEYAFVFNCYSVDGFIIEKYSSVKDHFEKVSKVKLEGQIQKYLNVSFDYSAVSETNIDLNMFRVIIRDSDDNELLQDEYSFASPTTSEKYSKRPYKQYRKSFDVSSLESKLARGTIEIFQHVGDYEMSIGPAVFVFSNVPHYK